MADLTVTKPREIVKKIVFSGEGVQGSLLRLLHHVETDAHGVHRHHPVIGIDRYVLPEEPGLSARVHCRPDASHCSRFQAVRTNHRGCTPSGGLQLLDVERFIPSILQFEQVYGRPPLDDGAEIMPFLFYLQSGTFPFLATDRTRTSENKDPTHKTECGNAFHSTVLFPSNSRLRIPDERRYE